MKRLAIFVEGQTEKIFVRKLLEEIAGKNNIAIEDRDLSLGRKVARITVLRMSDLVTNLDCEFLYLKLVNHVPSLGEFIQYIDEFMVS